MNINAITTKIVSTLGNKESLIPVMVKDGVDSASLTYKSFKEGGIIEGKDRAIDEFGTQAIWIGGIPFYKKLIDLTLYKYAKINPEVDPRILNNKEYASWALKNAKGIMQNDKIQSVQSAIKKCIKNNGSTAKKLYGAKVISATALTLITYFLMTKAKQKNTENNIRKELNSVNSHNIPSFKGNGKKLAEAIMFNPVHNMKIIDAGITSERLMCSRNKTEFFEHAIKEGGFLFFIYGFGNLIEKGINNFSNKFFKKPIDLKIDVLMDDKLKDSIIKGSLKEECAKLNFAELTQTKKLDFLINNPDNILVQSAKKAGIIKTTKDKAGKSFIDTSKYIDLKKLEELKYDLLNLDKNFKLSGENVNSYLNKVKALKVLSVLANIGISCLFLGYLIPKSIYKYREYKTGTKKFHVEENMKNNIK